MSSLPFAFDPTLFSTPPSAPAPENGTNTLFSAAETSDLFGFLDNFNDWDFGPEVFAAPQQPQSVQIPPFDGYLNAYAEGSPASAVDERPRTSSSSSTAADGSVRAHPYARPTDSQAHQKKASPSSPNGHGTARTPKALLSDPQKRMNHILSEQKRRNAIRSAYAELTALLAPAGAPPSTGLPTRGRPRGSGTKNKGKGGNDATTGAGKRGVLLRAVEYCRWLEEGRDALVAEIARVERAVGLTTSMPMPLQISGAEYDFGERDGVRC